MGFKEVWDYFKYCAVEEVMNQLFIKRPIVLF